jgi:hypothetical protein
MTERTYHGNKIYFKVKVSKKEGTNQFFFSKDQKHFQRLGEKFIANNGYWKGPKLGLFSYNEKQKGGTALFDWFHYDYDGPHRFLGE